jgi:N utilization substance protein B
MENTKHSRHKLRQEIITSLFTYDMTNEHQFDEETPEEIISVFHDVLKQLNEIDQIITNSLINWKLNRLSFMDRAIIRYATYEMYYTDIPKEIIINEAIILTRKFSDEGDSKQVAFNNKVLDTIAKGRYNA